MPRSPGEDDIRRVYRDTLDVLYGFVSRRCDGDRDLTQDIVQETWLRAVKAWRADGLPDRPTAWLCTVAARLLSNHRRRPAPASLEQSGIEPVAPHAPDADARTERRSLIERAIARLPAIQGALLEAFHFDRRSVADIAATSGTSQRAIEGRLRRARLKLRQEIERDPAARGELP